jgi:hypothetical protein
MPSKTKKQSVSLFGINDCHNPKKTRKNTLNNKKTQKRRTKPFDYKTIILFPHYLGQTKTGTEKSPEILYKYINKKRHVVKRVKDTNNMFKNISDLYKVNKSSKLMLYIGSVFMQEFEIRFKIAFFNAENRFTDLQLRTALGEVFPYYFTRYQRPGVVNGFDVNEDNLYCNLLMRDVEESLLINEFDGQEDSDDDYPFQHDSD